MNAFELCLRCMSRLAMYQEERKKMKLFIAISSCENWEKKGLNDPARKTWLPEATRLGLPYKFFHGIGSTPKEDVVVLNCDDSYRHLAAKFKAKTQWVLEQGYEYMFACQPDCYVRPERLLTSGIERQDYMGAVYRHETLGYYCQTGAAVVLSRKAMEILVADNIPSMHADGSLEGINSEDAWVGQALRRQAILPTHHDGFRIFGVSDEGPRQNNTTVTSHLSYANGVQVGYIPEYMYQKHREFLGDPQWMPATI